MAKHTLKCVTCLIRPRAKDEIFCERCFNILREAVERKKREIFQSNSY